MFRDRRTPARAREEWAQTRKSWRATRRNASLRVSLHETQNLDIVRLAVVAKLNQALFADPHLGPVCSDCYATLTATRVTLDKIGQLVGIGACSSETNR
jgi:hypothetical protein